MRLLSADMVSEFSITACIRQKPENDGYWFANSVSESTDKRCVALYSEGSKNQQHVYSGEKTGARDSRFLPFSPFLDTGYWTQTATVISSSQKKIEVYRDSLMRSNSTYTASFSTCKDGVTYIGRRSALAGTFIGRVKNVIIHSKALTVNEVAQMDNCQTPTPTPFPWYVIDVCKSAPCVVSQQMEVMFALDRSGSMDLRFPNDERTLFDALKDFARNTISCILASTGTGTQIRVGIVSFDGKATLDQSLTTDSSLLYSAIDRITTVGTDGETNPAVAMNVSVSHMLSAGRSSANRTIILVTDGEPCCNPTYASAAINASVAARSNGVRFLTVFIGLDEAGNTFLSTMIQNRPDFHFNAEDYLGITQLVASSVVGEICELTVLSDLDFSCANSSNSMTRSISISASITPSRTATQGLSSSFSQSLSMSISVSSSVSISLSPSLSITPSPSPLVGYALLSGRTTFPGPYTVTPIPALGPSLSIVGCLNSSTIGTYVFGNSDSSTLDRRCLALFVRDNTQVEVYYNPSTTADRVIFTGVNLFDATWHHFGLTVTFATPTVFRLYIDGALRGTQAATFTVSTCTGGSMLLGARPASSSFQFSGQMSQITAYNGIITAADMSSLSTNTQCSTIKTTAATTLSGVSSLSIVQKTFKSALLSVLTSVSAEMVSIDDVSVVKSNPEFKSESNSNSESKSKSKSDTIRVKVTFSILSFNIAQAQRVHTVLTSQTLTTNLTVVLNAMNISSTQILVDSLVIVQSQSDDTNTVTPTETSTPSTDNRHGLSKSMIGLISAVVVASVFLVIFVIRIRRRYSKSYRRANRSRVQTRSHV
eukprot:c10022_g1_i2.p1 GENE.c10022_g1_i2~~c10022_g1_i2.p1  ORF type:complete len:930 (-),score=265.16 c10022_g1_i2:52-2529(-)